MATAKVIEVIGEGSSIEDATKSAVKQASKTVKNIRSVYIKGQQGVVDNGEVTSFRVNVKITFVVSE